MIINELLRERNMSRYRLSKLSGVAMTTLTDICNGKTSLEKCSAGNLYSIAKALGVTVDYLIENNKSENQTMSFEVFRSNVCHYVKDMGDVDFIIYTLESNQIRLLYEKEMYRESFYLLAMVDYLSRINELPKCENYNDIRSRKLVEPYYPQGVLLMSSALNDEGIKQAAFEKAIPEFLNFNIVENEVRDVV